MRIHRDELVVEDKEVGGLGGLRGFWLERPKTEDTDSVGEMYNEYGMPVEHLRERTTF